MRDYLDIGPTPSDEPCQQVGTRDYDASKARAECRRFIDAIRLTLGDEPEGAQLKIRGEPHDFGTALSVVCYYDDAYPASIDYAFKCESDSPPYWPRGV